MGGYPRSLNADAAAASVALRADGIAVDLMCFISASAVLAAVRAASAVPSTRMANGFKLRFGFPFRKPAEGL